MPTATPNPILDIPTALPNFLSPDALFNNIVQLITLILGIAAFIAIVYSGLMMITSDGDASKMAMARKNLLWAIIGLIVAILSYFLVATVYNTFKDGKVDNPRESRRLQQWA